MRMGVRSAALFSISVVGTLGREIAKAKTAGGLRPTFQQPRLRVQRPIQPKSDCAHTRSKHARIGNWW